MNINIIIVGVGGQGILLASKILGNIALDSEMDIKVSEVHGMAQRGGSVITHVKIGKSLKSPLISPKKADYIIAFEELEAMRALGFLKKDGVLILNQQKILPMPIIIAGEQEYHQVPYLKVGEIGKIDSIDALKIAKQVGNQRTVNTVLLGKLSTYLGFDEKKWQKAIKNAVRSDMLEVNIKAFEAGRSN